jgi:hypothetical protein
MLAERCAELGGPLKLVISVDVEEEGLFSGTYDRKPRGVENVRRLNRLEFITREFGLPLTLLATYHVVLSPFCRDILMTWRDGFRAEIGAHLHPWNTPPFQDIPFVEPVATDLLPVPLVRKKLGALLAAFNERMQVRPLAFRMGRFDLGRQVAAMLPQLGFRVDSSVVPLRKVAGGPDHFLAPSDPYLLAPSGCMSAETISENSSETPFRPGAMSGALTQRMTEGDIVIPAAAGIRKDGLDSDFRWYDGLTYLQKRESRGARIPSVSAFAEMTDDRNRLILLQAPGLLLEVPLTQVGLFPTSPNSIYRLASKMSRKRGDSLLSAFRHVAVAGIQPAWFPLTSMKLATRIHIRRGGRVLTMFLHSSELYPGATPSFRSEAAVDRLIAKIRSYLTWLLRTEPIQGATLSGLYDSLFVRSIPTPDLRSCHLRSI